MERAIIYYAKTGLEATDHFVPKLLEKYFQEKTDSERSNQQGSHF